MVVKKQDTKKNDDLCLNIYDQSQNKDNKHHSVSEIDGNLKEMKIRKNISE